MGLTFGLLTVSTGGFFCLIYIWLVSLNFGRFLIWLIIGLVPLSFDGKFFDGADIWFAYCKYWQIFLSGLYLVWFL
jgi:hypothetical protein